MDNLKSRHRQPTAGKGFSFDAFTGGPYGPPIEPENNNFEDVKHTGRYNNGVWYSVGSSGRPREDLDSEFKAAQQQVKLQGSPSIRHQTVYRIHNSDFPGQPTYFKVDEERDLEPIGVNELYYSLEADKNTMFIVTRDFVALPGEDSGHNGEAVSASVFTREPVHHTVLFLPGPMQGPMQEFLCLVPGFGNAFPGFNLEQEHSAPYKFWFYAREFFSEAINAMRETRKPVVRYFMYWIETEFGDEFRFVDNQFKNGMVSHATMEYLVRPGDVLISRRTEAVASCMAYRRLKALDAVVPERVQPRASDLELEAQQPPLRAYRWRVAAWAWTYDGMFQREPMTMYVRVVGRTPYSEMRIVDLEVFPLRYEDQQGGASTRALLSRRGQRFWRCCQQRVVGYIPDHAVTLDLYGERFLVDVPLARRCHFHTCTPRNSNYTMRAIRFNPHDEGAHPKFDLAHCPSGDELRVFPGTILGYSLSRRVWMDLVVDRLEEVVWGSQLLSNLALEKSEQYLMRTLMTRSNKAAYDLLDPRHRGRVLLMQGGPGTGKTLVAQGLADVLRRPFLRFNCAERLIGRITVEDMLRQAQFYNLKFHCVVAFDNVETLLEGRGSNGVFYNSFAAFFMEQIKEIHGPVVLSSRRVGYFDEQICSRATVVLRFPNLSVHQRVFVWFNLFRRIEDKDELIPAKNRRSYINMDELKSRIMSLALMEKNGYQIRRAVSEAREQARYNKEPLRLYHLLKVLKVIPKSTPGTINGRSVLEAGNGPGAVLSQGTKRKDNGEISDASPKRAARPADPSVEAVLGGTQATDEAAPTSAHSSRDTASTTARSEVSHDKQLDCGNADSTDARSPRELMPPPPLPPRCRGKQPGHEATPKTSQPSWEAAPVTPRSEVSRGKQPAYGTPLKNASSPQESVPPPTAPMSEVARGKQPVHGGLSADVQSSMNLGFQQFYLGIQPGHGGSSAGMGPDSQQLYYGATDCTEMPKNSILGDMTTTQQYMAPMVRSSDRPYPSDEAEANSHVYLPGMRGLPSEQHSPLVGTSDCDQSLSSMGASSGQYSLPNIAGFNHNSYLPNTTGGLVGNLYQPSAGGSNDHQYQLSTGSSGDHQYRLSAGGSSDHHSSSAGGASTQQYLPSTVGDNSPQQYHPGMLGDIMQQYQPSMFVESVQCQPYMGGESSTQPYPPSSGVDASHFYRLSRTGESRHSFRPNMGAENSEYYWQNKQ